MSVGTDTGFLIYRGRSPSSWVKRLLNPRNYWKLLDRIQATWPRRFLVLFMLLPLHFRPQLLYRFSTDGLLPAKHERLVKTPDPRDDFGLDRNRSSELPTLNRVTVIQKGISFDESKLGELPGPIYAVNWPEKLSRHDVVYVTGDFSVVSRFMSSDMFPIMFTEINWFNAQGKYIARDAGTEMEKRLDDPRIQRIALYHHAGPHRSGMPATSGLSCVVALSFFAQDIEVYGWDFYLPFSPAHAGYWKSFLRTFVNFRMELQSQFIEMSIHNWHYAYRFSQLPGFKNHGYLSGLERHSEINKRLDKIFYNV